MQWSLVFAHVSFLKETRDLVGRSGKKCGRGPPRGEGPGLEDLSWLSLDTHYTHRREVSGVYGTLTPTDIRRKPQVN
jgi:hypothetical protein